jgi:hypothetical protein
MAQTVIRGTQILNNTVQRQDLDTSTVGQALVTKIVQGTNVTLSSTGADSGTGDVTISVPGGGVGPAGPAGSNATTTTAVASFTVPASGSTTTVNVADASWIIVGQPLYFDTAGGGAGLPGYLIVTAKTGNQLTVKTP